MNEEENINKNSEEKNTEFRRENNVRHFPEDTHATKQPVTSDQQPSTENMEVHKHPHHVTNKKKWGEYFLEFLMIFLAVTLGFFAENIREHITESHREKEFARQLYSELKEDSTVLDGKILERKQKEKDMEYVAAYFTDSSLDNLPERFYPALAITLYLFNRYEFEPKDGILSQLKNSGSLGYFKSVYLQKLVGDLSVSINNIRERNNQEYQYWSNPIKPFMLRYFDFNWLTKLRNINDTSAIATLMYDYDKLNFHVKGMIRNLSALDRGEASNIILFYKQMIVSTRTLQLKDYVVTNHKILEELRRNYRLE